MDKSAKRIARSWMSKYDLSDIRQKNMLIDLARRAASVPDKHINSESAANRKDAGFIILEFFGVAA